jgi:tetratricopeptide (TPR) repeat protein
VFAYDEALEFHRHAHECAEGLDRPELLERVEEALARVHGLRGDAPAAAEHYGRALALCGEPAGRGRLKALIADALVRVGDPRATQYLDHALAELDAARQPRERATALMAAGRHHHLLGAHTRAAELLKEALALAEPTGDVSLQSLIMSYLAGAYQHLAQFDDSDAWANRCIALGEAHQDPSAIASGYEFLSENANSRGEPLRSIAWSGLEMDLVRRIHSQDREGWTYFCMAFAHQIAGALPEAESAARECLSICDRIAERRLHVFAEGVLGIVLAERGAWEDASHHLRSALEDAQRAKLFFMHCESLRGLAYLARLEGRYDETLRRAAEVRELLGSREARMVPVRLAAIEIEALARLDRLDEAAERLAAGLALAEKSQMRFFFLELVRQRGEIAAGRGDVERSESDFSQVLLESTERSLRSLEARTLGSRARWRRRRGDREGARADRARAEELFTACGAEGLRREMHRLDPDAS